jgi:hypothetical protein
MRNYDELLRRAIKHFWKVRGKQGKAQGAVSGVKDAGFRSAVTGGKHLDGFISLLQSVLIDAGLPEAQVHTRGATIPGYFRPTKDWDLIVAIDDILLASIECKAHIGPSFGNNFNNRIEEALGNSVDVLTAFREGAFSASHRPWLGWMMILEEAPRSTAPVKVEEPYFPVRPEFAGASYAKRYELFCEKLLRERMYDGVCLLMSSAKTGLKGEYHEPNSELGFSSFVGSLLAKVIAFQKSR